MIINTQTVKKSSGGNNNYSVLGGILDNNELIYPSTKTPAGTVFELSNNPADYTKVDWLESSGTQRIETGIVMDTGKTLRLKGDFYFSDVTTRQCTGSQGHFYIGVINGKYQVGNPGNESSNVSVSANNWHEFDVTYLGASPSTPNNVNATLDESYSYSTSLPYSPAIQNKVCLFSLNDQILPCSCKMGRTDFEIYVNSVLTRVLISCYHTATGIKGFFDSVNNRFYMNAGTGDFTKPSDTSGEINLAEYLASLT